LKELKIMIIILLILICILSILRFSIKQKNEENNNLIQNNNTNEYSVVNTVVESYPDRSMVNIESQDVQFVENRTDYFTVQEIVNKYLNILYSRNENELINILDKNYIENNNIGNIQNYENSQQFVAKEIYYRVDNNISTYFVYGTIEEQIMDEKMPEYEFNITVIVDYNTNAFSIIPKEISNINTYRYEGSSIEVNDDNTYQNIMITDGNMANIYLNAYKEDITYNIEDAYNSLNEEYRNKRFGNIEEYKKYLNNKFEAIGLINLDKYLIKERDGYIEYVLIDTEGNYYIFNEKSVMNYEVILDTYTIDVPEFIEKYNSGDEEEKVKLSIGRFLEAIYEKDYQYAYNKLHESFKAQTFNTIEEFENYIKNIFSDNVSIEYNEFLNLDGRYSYLLIIENDGATYEKRFTVELLGGTDYTISFDV